MRKITYFFLGVLTAIASMPIINKITELITLWIEAVKVKPTEKILDYEKKVVTLSDFISPINNSVYNYNDDIDYINEDDIDD